MLRKPLALPLVLSLAFVAACGSGTSGDTGSSGDTPGSGGVPATTGGPTSNGQASNGQGSTGLGTDGASTGTTSGIGTGMGVGAATSGASTATGTTGGESAVGTGGAGTGTTSGTVGGGGVAPTAIDGLMISPNPNSVLSCIVTWTTDQAATSVVQFGLAGYQWEISDSAVTTAHRVVVIGMRREQTYSIKAVSANDGGSVEAEGDFSTGVLPAAIPVGTVQINDKDQKTIS